MTRKAFPVGFGLKKRRCPFCKGPLGKATLSRSGGTVSMVCPKRACGKETPVFWLGGDKPPRPGVFH